MYGGPRLRDRREAGHRLAQRLLAYRETALVLGLPRGGLVVAAEIARALEAPLDVLIARKLGAPGNPELAIGAIAEGGEPCWNEEAIELTGASPAYRTRAVERGLAEITRARAIFRGGKDLPVPSQGTILLVDDGVATGATFFAAVEALRRRFTGRLMAAIPVAPPDTAEELGRRVDDLVVLLTPASLDAVGGCYVDFKQVSDEEVQALLGEAEADGRRWSSLAERSGDR
jgi:putative phosphoribosyl transferase